MKRNSKRTKYEFRPHGWQLESSSLCTQSNQVQYWHNGLMAGLIDKSEAQKFVRNGVAFVISEQAVGAMVDGVSHA